MDATMIWRPSALPLWCSYYEGLTVKISSLPISHHKHNFETNLFSKIQFAPILENKERYNSFLNSFYRMVH